MQQHPPVIVSIVDTSRQADVSRELFAASPPTPAVAGLFASLERGETASTGMLVARRSDRLVGAVWFQPLAGALARVWPAILRRGEARSTAGLLQAAADRHLATQGTRLAQALLPDTLPSDFDDSHPLRACGYLHAADLAFLVSFPSEAPEHRPAVPFELRAYQPPGDQPELLRLLRLSYQGSRDLPSLLGARSPEMILAGYEEAARIGSRLWFLVVHAGQPIGCLLLADQAEQDQLELLYVGLSPSARGKQWGLELVRYGQWEAARAGRSRVVLAVDAANEPATRMYASAGFRIWDQQRMFAKVLPVGRPRGNRAKS